jgi:hypothetical protein
VREEKLTFPSMSVRLSLAFFLRGQANYVSGVIVAQQWGESLLGNIIEQQLPWIALALEKPTT